MEQDPPGYDDWFDEPAPPTQEASRGSGGYEDADDVWVLPEDEQRRTRRTADGSIVVLGVTLTTTQAAIVAAAVLAVFFGILAAAGVFSGGKTALPTISITTASAPVTHTTATTSTTPLVVAPTQPLKPGDTGKQVKNLQQALNALGFKVGKPDGNYGPNTQAAVEQFQSQNGLTADGVVGQQTLTALQQALSG